jgi:hypothetical protein
MKNRRFDIRLIIALTLFAAAAGAVAPWAYAGGPLLVRNGQPVRWASREIRGGQLNSQTVDAQGRVLYRVDSGRLGPFSNARAVALVDHIFQLYTDIPTATIEFVNAGFIRDPDSGQTVDVTGANFGKFIRSSAGTFQNPIIFDHDGSILGDGGVLGQFGFVQFDAGSNSILEGYVILNGATVNSIGGEIPFQGVFTHEFGHFAGPLDHSQVNGNVASFGEGVTLPPGFSRIEAFDLYMPFTETLYPFLFPGSNAGDALAGSMLRREGFGNSGFFTATLDLDTMNALSNLYATNDYHSSRGSIEGRVVIRTNDGDIPVTGINIVARRINRGQYPPAPGTLAFPGNQVLLGLDDVPLVPPDQDATDSLATASSAVTGMEFGPGAYRIDGLPPGEYLLEIQQINPRALRSRGSGIGPREPQFTLPIEEFYSGPRESGDATTDTPSDFFPVLVTAGSVASGIDIILNFSTSAPSAVPEKEPNDKKPKAQKLTLPVEVTAAASPTDKAVLKLRLSNGMIDPVEDLYRFTVEREGTYFIILQSTSGAGDLDLYLFNSSVGKKKASVEDGSLEDASTSPGSTEVVAVQLFPGTYTIGVSAFSGVSQGYKLRVDNPR